MSHKQYWMQYNVMQYWIALDLQAKMSYLVEMYFVFILEAMLVSHDNLMFIKRAQK